MNEKIQHIKCSICGKEITEREGDDEAYGMIFRVSRSKELFDISEEGELDFKEGNEKMSMEFCEECFVEILNESETLGSLFLSKDKDCFIY